MNNKKKSIKFHYGMNSAILTVLFVIAVIFVNLIVGALTDRFPSMNIDMSENKQFVLSKETKDAISKIDKDVKITVVLYSDDTDMYYDDYKFPYNNG